MKIHAAASCKASMEYILEQTSHKMDAHLDVIGKQDKPVAMVVDALLAKVTAVKR